MDDAKAQLLRWIDEDREHIVGSSATSSRPRARTRPATRPWPLRTSPASSSAPAPLPCHRAPAHHAEHRGLLRRAQARAPSGAQRSHGRVPGRRAAMSTGRTARGAGRSRRQNLRPRGSGHESWHVGLHLYLRLPVPPQRPSQGTADAYRGLGRGNVRPVGRPVSDGASPRGAR